MEMQPLRHRKPHGPLSVLAGDVVSTRAQISGCHTYVSHSPRAPPRIEPTDSLEAPEVNEDESIFKEYHVLNYGLLNISLCSGSADNETPTYIVINSTFTRGVPDVVLRFGIDRTGPILAVTSLTLCGVNTFGIGDPSADREDQVVWEELRRVSKWTHSTYHFEWDWGDGERRKYEWRRTTLRPFADQNDLELVERGRESAVLASYNCAGIPVWKRRGLLKIRAVDEPDQSESGTWEAVVIVTAMSLIELSRRRSRSRRKF